MVESVRGLVESQKVSLGSSYYYDYVNRRAVSTFAPLATEKRVGFEASFGAFSLNFRGSHGFRGGRKESHHKICWWGGRRIPPVLSLVSWAKPLSCWTVFFNTYS